MKRSPSRTADRSGAERRGELPCVGACSLVRSFLAGSLVWELVRSFARSSLEPLNRRRREDGLNSTHIFQVKSATVCTEVTVTGKMWIGPPKDRCGRILETWPFARERPPFCLRKRNQSRDTKYTLFTYIYTACTARTNTLFTHIYGQKTYTTHTEANISRSVQLTPVGGPTAREGEDITVTSLFQCAVKYNHRELEVELCTLLY